ncbi:MAG: oligosaccharide flippase family protein [Treponema sp.]|nr:oligosaccharide flippase family protein [Treponema sp.]
MKIERSKNTARNSFWGILSTILLILFPFINRTVLIKFLGAEYLGLNGLFASILQMLNLTECGFSSAIIFSMFKPIANDNKEEICALLGFYKRVYRIVGGIIFIAGICCIPFLNFIISGTIPAGMNIHIIYLIHLANTSVSYFLFAYKNALLSAHQRNDIQHKILMVCRIGQFALQLLSILFFKNFYLYTFCMVIFTVLNNLITSKVVSSTYPEYYCSGKIRKEQKDEIKEKVSGLIIIKLAGTTRDSLDSIFISKFMGLTSVAIFSNYFYILTAVHGVIQVIATSMSAGVGNSIATESKLKNYQDFRKIMFLYLWIACWCISCMANLYQPFMQFWVGTDLMLDFSIVILLCIYFWLQTIGDIKGIYTGALGLWWQCRFRAIAETLCNFVLNYIFVKNFGYAGILFASVLTLLFVNYIYDSFILFRNYFTEFKIARYFLQHLLYSLICAAITAICFIMTKFITISNSYLSFLLKTIAITLMANSLLFFIYKKTDIFKQSAKIMATILPTKLKRRFTVL